MNRTSRLLAVFSVLLATLVLGGWVIKETKQDEDIAFYVNDGGVVTEAMRIVGSTTAVILTGNANVRASEGAGTTTLTNADKRIQSFDLSAARTVVLPTTSIKQGDQWWIYNRGAFDLTVQSSDLTAIDLVRAGFIKLRALQDAPTAPSHWVAEDYLSEATISFAVQHCTTSPTEAFHVYRRGNMVNITLKAWAGALTKDGTSGGVGTLTGVIPTWAQPSSDRRSLIFLSLNATLADSQLIIETNGRWRFYNDVDIGTNIASGTTNINVSYNVTAVYPKVL